jgi:hypothetical protein
MYREMHNNWLEQVKGDLGIDWVILLIWAFMNRVKNFRVLYVSENCLVCEHLLKKDCSLE